MALVCGRLSALELRRTSVWLLKEEEKEDIETARPGGVRMRVRLRQKLR